MSEVETIESNTVGGGSFIALDSGSTHFVRSESTRGESRRQSTSFINETGVIYTRAEDMPTLEELLERSKVAYAVLEKEVPMATSVRAQRQWLVVAAAGVAGGTAIGGFIAFLDSIDDAWIRANPYTALTYALGGLVLIATLLTALRSKR